MSRIKILNNIFTFLNEEFNYAVIHHIDEIVDSKKDIDFVIDVKKEDLYISFKLFSKINKYHTVNMYTIDINVFRIDIVYMNDIKQEYELLQLDFFTDDENKNLMPIRSSELLKDKFLVSFNNISIYSISQVNELDYYIMKKAYKRQDIKIYLDYLLNFGIKNEKQIFECYKNYHLYFNSYKYKFKYLINKLTMIKIRNKEKINYKIELEKYDSISKKELIDYLKDTLIFRYIYVVDEMSILDKIKQYIQPSLTITFIDKKITLSKTNYSFLKDIIEKVEIK